MDGYYYQPKFVNSEYMNLCQPCKHECVISKYHSTVEYLPSKPISTGSQAITSSTSGVMLVSTIATGTSLTSIVSVGDIMQYLILCEDKYIVLLKLKAHMSSKKEKQHHNHELTN